nr:immunoglobulin light chain junction region [Macaca mulatta]
CQQYDNSPPTF